MKNSRLRKCFAGTFAVAALICAAATLPMPRPALLALQTPSAAGARADAAYGKLPLSFEANRGQADHGVDFLARGPRYSLLLTPAEATFVLQPSAEDNGAPTEAALLRMSFAGASQDSAPDPLGQLEGRVNYFIGNDPAAWRTNIPTFAQVRYKDIYPGIDLVYYGNQQQLEYDLVIAPGADWRQIAITFSGTDGLTIDTETGDLLARIGDRTVRQHKPIVYQEAAGQRRKVESGYIVASNGRVEFSVGDYDRTKALIIDPVLVYATYVGADSGGSTGNAIAVDSAGSAYITGSTVNGFPTTSGAYDTIYNGGVRDVFVTKLNPAGTALVYSTYIGGGADAANEVEVANAIALDADGNAYITGRTQAANFPTTEGAFDRTFNGGRFDGFVTKLNSTGTALIYSTFLGGSSDGLEECTGIAVNAAGNAFVTGRTFGTSSGGSVSTTFPTTVGAYATTMQCTVAVFVTKLNPTGTGLDYSTLLDASEVHGIAIDEAGNAYITGRAQAGCTSTHFPTTSGAYKTGGVADEDDIFVTKFNSTGTGLVYSTRFGADCNTGGFASGELPSAIAIDSTGSAYIRGGPGSCYNPNTGEYFSTFPTTPGAYDTIWNTGDGFAAKFNSSGSALVYSTFLPGGGAPPFAVDTAGNVWLVSSGGIAPTQDAFDKVNENGFNPLIAKLNSTGSGFLYCTYFGGNSRYSFYIGGLALDPDGDVYFAGGWDTVPTTPGAYKTTTVSPTAFVAKIGKPAPVVRVTSVKQTGTKIVMQGVGVPNESYPVKATEDLSQPFETIGMTTVADANGNFQFQDTPGPEVSSRFYELILP